MTIQAATEPTTDSVYFRIYPFRELATWGILPGFYWTVPYDENGNIVPPQREGVFEGPYDTHEAASAAAIAFLEDILTEH